MATWLVRGDAGEVRVEAGNWLGALGLAIPRLGMSPGALGRLVCSVGPDGAADACDPQTNTRLRIEPIRSEAPPPIAMPTPQFTMSPPAFDPMRRSIDSSMDEVFELEEALPDEVSPDVPTEDGLAALDAARSGAGPVSMPEWMGDGGLDDRMELVFDRCAVIVASLDVRSACAAALTVLAELVPADAGAVLVRTRSGNSLRFAAAFGPRAQRVIDTAIPIDQGIAGFCHGFNMGVIVDEVDADQRHYDRVDRASGYRTRSLLAVPIVSDGTQTSGCIELLNSPTRFAQGDLEVARVVAGALAEWLAPALD